MNFRVDRWSAMALRSSLVILTTVGALLLSSCGGGGQSSQSKRFKPTRMFVFGDEASLLLPPTTTNGIDSRKYTNNGVVTGTTVPQNIDCGVNPLWVQKLALEYGLVFAECNPGGFTPTAFMRAVAGGKVADVVAAVDAFLASTTPVPTDMITMMVGTHDILEMYDSVKAATLTQDAAVAEIKRRADLVAAQIDRLTNRNNTLGRVMYSTVPDVNATPFGLAKPPADQTLLKLLSDSFNFEMRLKIYDNGRSRGFLDTSQQFRNVLSVVLGGNTVSNSDTSNATDAVCLQPNDVLNCTTLTQIKTGTPPTVDTTATDHLWAGNINFSEAGHFFIGTDAVDLATSLPW